MFRAGDEQELKMKPEEEMEQQLPPGISESGEVVDMAAYEVWQQENRPGHPAADAAS